jgi:hypothetical protein
MVRSWAWASFVCALAAAIPPIVPLVFEVNPVLVLVYVAAGMLLSLVSFATFLMFLDDVAEMFQERGLSDSINGLMKLWFTFILCVAVLFVAQLLMMWRRFETALPPGDPTALIFDVCSGAFMAFTVILGLVVYIKYILALLNVRAMVEWAAE